MHVYCFVDTSLMRHEFTITSLGCNLLVLILFRSLHDTQMSTVPKISFSLGNQLKKHL